MSVDNRQKEFNLVKNLYCEFRRDDKEKLSLFLIDNGYKILNSSGGVTKNLRRCGEGKKNYKGNYDLSNWQYIYARKGNKYFFISLQCFDKDSSSCNRHILMDRVGVCVYNKYPKNFADAIDIMQNTNVDLPLDEKKMQILLGFLR